MYFETLSDSRKNKKRTAALIGALLGPLLLAGCGGDPVEATSQTVVDTTNLPVVNFESTGLSTVSEAKNLLDNTMGINMLGTETEPLFEALNGSESALKDVGITKAEIIANYLVGSYFLGEIADTRSTTTNEATILMINAIRGQTFLFGSLINLQTNGRNVMQDFELSCPTGPDALGQTLRPGLFGFTEERFQCTGDASDYAKKASVSVADIGLHNNELEGNKDKADVAILTLFKNITTLNDTTTIATIKPLTS